MGGINQIGKEAVTFHFCLRWAYHAISKDLWPWPWHGNLSHWLTKFLSHQWIQYDHKEAYGLLLVQTFWTSAFSQLKVKHPSFCQLYYLNDKCFVVIGSIASTTPKFLNYIRAEAIENFVFELEKIGNTSWRFKSNSNFTKEKDFTDIIF